MIKGKKEIPFLIAISFLLSLIFIRLSVLIAGSANSEFAQAAKAGSLPEKGFYIGSNIILFGYHIHHFYFGILLIAIAGWLAIAGSNYLSKKHTAIIYGVGLGLLLDEIGLLLTWGDYYSSLTYVLSLIILGIFFNILFFGSFWESVKKNLLKSKPHTLIEGTTQSKLFGLINKLTSKTKPASLLFTAILQLTVGVMILIFPGFVRYWIAGAFLIYGASYLISPFREVKYEI